MSIPFFSIIIPTLNEERFLPRLLMALVKQNYRSFEIIVVDGNSTDRTTIEAERFSSKLPSLAVYSVDKRNVSYQRNYGASKASGKYLVFFDADVLIPQYFLAKLRDRLRQDRPAMATTWMRPDSSRLQDEILITLANLALETAKAIGRPLLPGFNTIVKREVFAEIGGFNIKLKLAEDHELATRAARYGYLLSIYRQPLLTASLRRFRHVGTINILILYTLAGLHVLLKGPIRENIFHYPMGGHLYQTQTRRRPSGASTGLSVERFLSFDLIHLKPSRLRLVIERSKKEVLEKLRSQFRQL